MSTEYIEQTTALIERIEGRELVPHAIRLLSGGEPVALEELAAAAGRSVEAVDAALKAQISAERDDRGRLVGLALTLRPTTHRFTVDRRTLFAWCASDTLMLPDPRPPGPRRIHLPADRPADPHRAHARHHRTSPPARRRHVRPEAPRRAGRRALDHLRPRALLQLDDRRRRVERRAPRRPPLPRRAGLPARPGGHQGAGLGRAPRPERELTDHWAR
jgi:Helix-turn-helix domain of alkylmercury lyase/Alkylmercury lyase